MTYFIATDLHGSAYWADKVVAKFAASGADMLVLLGDVYNHGPRNPFPQDYAPMRVADALNAVADKLVAVKGNCDSEVDQMISTFPFVGENIVSLGGHRVMFTHGHIYNKDSLPLLTAGDTVVYGHFHINEYNLVDGINCVALSSCSLPKNGCVAAYALCNENSLTVYDFDDNEILKVPFNAAQTN